MSSAKHQAAGLADYLELAFDHTPGLRGAAAQLRRIEALEKALASAKWMLERDYIDDQKLAVIEQCGAAMANTGGAA